MLFFSGLTVVTPAQGQMSDWIIQDKGVVLADQQKEMAKSIIIEKGGELTISNSTVTFDLTADGTEGITVKAGGTLTVVDSEITSKNILMTPHFYSYGTLKVERATIHRIWGKWPDGGGIQVKGGSAVITDTEFVENKRDGITVHSGSASIMSSTFRENTVGIRCQGAEGTLITDNHFTENSQQGMLIIDSTATIKRNVVENNNIGIAVSGSDVNIKEDNQVTKNVVGIDVADGSKAVITDNTVNENTEAGIRQTSSETEIRDNEIKSNEDGIHAVGGEFLAMGNSLIGNGNGVVSIGSQGSVSSNEIGGCNNYGIYAVGDPVDYTTNSWTAVNGEGRYAQAWGFQVNVTKKGQPVENAVVKIFDKSRDQVHSGITNQTGLTEVFEVMESHVDNSGNIVDATPHTIRVETKKDKGSKKLLVTKNQTLEVELGDDKDDGGMELHVLLLGIGIILMAVSISLGIHYWHSSKDDGKPKRKSKRAPKGRKRHRKAPEKKASRSSRRKRRPGKKRRRRR
jgi:parallel beta-helix repeat protein